MPKKKGKWILTFGLVALCSSCRGHGNWTPYPLLYDVVAEKRASQSSSISYLSGTITIVGVEEYVTRTYSLR
jgi:hypothetical protein